MTSIMSDIRAHAISAYPEEACGLLVDGGYVPCENVHSEPTCNFKIEKEVWIRYSADITSVVHSHPDGPDCPTASDMSGQISTGVPWIVVSTDGVRCAQPFTFGGKPLPLVGRPFRHGVTDCYSLIRDYYKLERNIEIKEFPRDWEWWLEGQDLYQSGFSEAGFERISASEVQAGDVFLAQVRSKVPNHGGVYIGDGLALHHLSSRDPVDPSRLSAREPIGRWQSHITHWLRYVG